MLMDHPEWSCGSETDVTLWPMVCQVVSQVATPHFWLEYVCKYLSEIGNLDSSFTSVIHQFFNYVNIAKLVLTKLSPTDLAG